MCYLKAVGYVHLERFLFYHLYHFDDFENYDYVAYEKSDSLNAPRLSFSLFSLPIHFFEHVPFLFFPTPQRVHGFSLLQSGLIMIFDICSVEYNKINSS